MNARKRPIIDIVERIDAAAARAPKAPALTAGRTTLTYADLVRASWQVADDLVALEGDGSLRPGSPQDPSVVAVVGLKTPEAVAGLLGVLRWGGTFVALDPRAPLARQRQLLGDAGCEVVLAPAGSDPALLERLAADGRQVIPVRSGKDDLHEQRTRRRRRETGWYRRTHEAAAYCLYTSGSTGTPKGVLIPHRALAAFFDAIPTVMPATEDSVWLNTSAFHFDVSVVDTWYPLTLGAHVHLSSAVLLPGSILGTIQRERVTHLAAVGSTLSLLAQRGNGLAAYDLSSVRRIMTGAEVLNPATVAAWLEAAPDAVVVNGYGPTEATCLVLAHEIDAAHADPAKVIPIGRELPGTTVRFLLDGSGAVAPCGPGEILIGGPQVMTGYHRRPDLSGVAFLHIGDQQFYRTGDYGRRDGDGVVWFDGRRDEQVKIGGHRVDLSEIRAALESHPGVVSALVWPEQDSRGKDILVASVEIRGEAAATTTDESLLARCRERLPAHMVPSWVTVQAAFPRLSSGKVDVVAVRAATRAAGAEEAA
ncbi:MAG: amino acid adenylation domain-containing protein [Tetrasphaera sp.]